jgi:DNA-directed RNA polymerase specialized sigma24 family protein
VEPTDRIERLLALLLLAELGEANQGKKILQLNLAGFSNIEIAELLGTTSAVVSQRLYTSKKEKPVKKSAPRTAPGNKQRRTS